MGKLKKKFSMFNYTKKWTSVILVFCLIWISMSYIVRAFFDTYCEKNYYLKMYRECRGKGVSDGEERAEPNKTAGENEKT